MKRSRSESTIYCCYNDNYSDSEESNDNIYDYRDMNPSERKKLKSSSNSDNLETEYILDKEGFSYTEWEDGTIKSNWISYDYPFPIIFPVR